MIRAVVHRQTKHMLSRRPRGETSCREREVASRDRPTDPPLGARQPSMDGWRQPASNSQPEPLSRSLSLRRRPHSGNRPTSAPSESAHPGPHATYVAPSLCDAHIRTRITQRPPEAHCCTIHTQHTNIVLARPHHDMNPRVTHRATPLPTRHLHALHSSLSQPRCTVQESPRPLPAPPPTAANAAVRGRWKSDGSAWRSSLLAAGTLRLSRLPSSHHRRLRHRARRALRGCEP